MRRAKILIHGLRSVLAFLVPIRFYRNTNGLDVSLTSYGYRIFVVGIAISSFCHGSRAIRDVYLAIDDEEEITLLKRVVFFLLQVKGVRIIRGPRRGPHAKYWHYLHSQWNGERSFILIDDDVVYDPGTADLLCMGAVDAPFNACVRSLCFQADAQGTKPYRSWPLCTAAGTSPFVFATNVGGVVIRPVFAKKLVELGEGYQAHCKHADDVWFHWISVRYGMPYSQITPAFRNPTPIPFSQGGALSGTLNVAGNDISIRSTYSSVDLEAMMK